MHCFKNQHLNIQINKCYVKPITSSRKRRGSGVLLSRATATLEAMQYLLNQAHLCVSAQQGRVSNSRSQARATSTYTNKKRTHFQLLSGPIRLMLLLASPWLHCIITGGGGASGTSKYYGKDFINCIRNHFGALKYTETINNESIKSKV